MYALMKLVMTNKVTRDLFLACFVACVSILQVRGTSIPSYMTAKLPPGPENYAPG